MTDLEQEQMDFLSFKVRVYEDQIKGLTEVRPDQTDLPARLREIAATVDDWNAPLCARVDLWEAARRLETQGREAMSGDEALREQAEAVAELVAGLRAERDELARWKADIMDTWDGVMAEVCEDPTMDDRKHCTCVPFLRMDITRLQRANRGLVMFILRDHPDADLEAITEGGE